MCSFLNVFGEVEDFAPTLAGEVNIQELIYASNRSALFHKFRCATFTAHCCIFRKCNMYPAQFIIYSVNSIHILSTQNVRMFSLQIILTHRK